MRKAQNVLAKWIIPDSGMSDHEALNELLGILDDSALVKQMKECITDDLIYRKVSR